MAGGPALIEPDRAAAQADLVGRLAAAAPGAPVAVAVIAPTHPAADLVRALEADAFPDIPAFLTDEVEARSRFVAVVDLGAIDPGVRHVLRVTCVRFSEAPVAPGTVGLPMVDEVIEANDLDADEVIAHYADRGIELANSIAVETNARVSASAAAPGGLRWSDFGYITVFQILLATPAVPDRRKGIFAHFNDAAVRSLSATGVVLESFARRDGLHTPAAQQGETDDRYSPRFIDWTDHNVGIFLELESLAAPTIELG